MRVIVLIAAFIICSANVYSQQAKATWGKEEKPEGTLDKMVKGEGLEVITMEHNPLAESPVLCRYDNTLQKQVNNKLTSTTSNTALLDILNVSGDVYMFTSIEDKKAKQFNYYAQKINNKTLIPEGKSLLLGSMESKKMYRDPVTELVFSEDSSKILFLCTAPNFDDEKERYTLAVLNSAMQILWQRTLELPYDSHKSEKITSYVTNNSEVGIPVNVYQKKTNEYDLHTEGMNIPAYSTKLMLYNKDENASQEIPVDIGDHYIHTIQLVTDGEQQKFFGLYKNQSNGKTVGFFTVSPGKNFKTIKIEKLNPFPSDLINLIAVDEQGSNKKGDPGISMFFYLRDVVQRKNGITDYVLQWANGYTYMGTPDYRGIGGRMFNTTGNVGGNNFGDVIDISVDKNEKTTYIRVPKMIFANNDWFGDVLITTYENKLLLFYSDDNDNLNQGIEAKPNRLKNIGKSAFVMATIDDKGKLNRSVVFQSSDPVVITCVRLSRKLTGNRFMLYALKGVFGRKQQVGMLEIK